MTRTSVRSLGSPPSTGSCITKSVIGVARCHAPSSSRPSSVSVSPAARRWAWMDLVGASWPASSTGATRQSQPMSGHATNLGMRRAIADAWRGVSAGGCTRGSCRNLSIIRISSMLVNGCRPCGIFGRPVSQVKSTGSRCWHQLPPRKLGHWLCRASHRHPPSSHRSGAGHSSESSLRADRQGVARGDVSRWQRTAACRRAASAHRTFAPVIGRVRTAHRGRSVPCCGSPSGLRPPGPSTFASRLREPPDIERRVWIDADFLRADGASPDDCEYPCFQFACSRTACFPCVDRTPESRARLPFRPTEVFECEPLVRARTRS